MSRTFSSIASALVMAITVSQGWPTALYAAETAPAAEPATQPTFSVVVGGPAPALTGKYVKGEAVTKYEPGKVYVMEFWATWCMPCKAAIPHLNELHKQYKDKGVVIIGQSVWEQDSALATEFAQKQGDDMAYTIAIDHTEGEPETSRGVMARTWLTAAGIKAIPSTWLVKDGKVLWMGHPKDLDAAKLDAALAGTFDIALALKENQKKSEDQKRQADAQQRYWDAVRDRDAAAVDAAIEDVKLAAPKNVNLVSYRVRADVALGRYAEAIAATENRVKGIEDPKKLFGSRLQAIQDLLIPNPTDKAFIGQVKSLLDATKIPETDNPASAQAILNKLHAWVAALDGDYKTAVELQEKALEAFAQSPLRPLEVRALDGYKNGKPPALMPAHSRDKKRPATQPTAAK